MFVKCSSYGNNDVTQNLALATLQMNIYEAIIM